MKIHLLIIFKFITKIFVIDMENESLSFLRIRKFMKINEVYFFAFYFFTWYFKKSHFNHSRARWNFLIKLKLPIRIIVIDFTSKKLKFTSNYFYVINIFIFYYYYCSMHYLKDFESYYSQVWFLWKTLKNGDEIVVLELANSLFFWF